jgi:WD40 repeat protein
LGQENFMPTLPAGWRTGGLGEPYCPSCYDSAGQQLFAAQAQNLQGPCAFCQTPVVLANLLLGSARSGAGATPGLVFPWRREWAFLCEPCRPQAEAFIAKIRECCECGMLFPGATVEARPTLPVPRTPSPSAKTDAHTGYVEAVAYSPDGKFVLSASLDGNLRLWDAATRKCVRVSNIGVPLMSLAWHPKGICALLGAQDNTIRKWSVNTGTVFDKLEGHSSYVRALAWSPSGMAALSGSDDKTMRLWYSGSPPIRSFIGHRGWVRSVAWSPDGKRAVSASEEAIGIWDVNTGKGLLRIDTGKERVSCMTLSPRGRYLISGGYDNKITMREFSNGQPVRTFEGHRPYKDNIGWVYSVAWSPDGRRILSAGADSTIRLWNGSTGECLRVIESTYANSVAWSPDGKTAVSGGGDSKRDDYRLNFWDLSEPANATSDADFIRYLCSECTGKLRTARTLAGKHLKCPHCKKRVTVPEE